ncbi:MAG: hypothetical protein GXP55_17725 [Deltaproteobacteria bacterium]|nr:hypothetical protein [Deltaproteobacteria bacterium]
MRKIHLMNEASRDATVAFDGVRARAKPALGLPGVELSFRRYVAATEAGRHAGLAAAHGDLAQALIDGDPEIDKEVVGRFIDETAPVYLAASGEVLHVSPRLVDVVFGPDGAERERKDAVNTPGNVSDETPVRWTGRKLPRRDALRRFAFRRTLALKHLDGLTHDFLFAMAEQLAKEDVLVMLGGGAKGKEPLIFQENGTPYRGFLEGRVDGARYKLLLHLSNLEIRVPDAAKA